ncbi:MAG: ATP-binding protein, partial [Alphaproteobacteria bacterium]
MNVWLRRLGAVAFCTLLPSRAFAASATEVAVFAAVAAALLAGLIAVVLAALGYRRRRVARAIATERARARRYEALVSTAPAGFFSWSVADGTESVGPSLAGVLGAAGNAIEVFADVTQRLKPEDAAELEKAVAGLRANGLGFQLSLKSADGERTFEVTGNRAAGPRNELLADMVWFRDVSAATAQIARLGESVASLAAERETFGRLLDAVDVPIWLRNSDLELMECNHAYARAVGADSPSAAIAGQREIAGGPTGWGRKPAERARASGKAQTQSLHVVIDGSRRLLEITELPLPKTGQVAGFALDRTDLEQTRDEMARHIAAHGEVLEKLGTAIVIFGPDTKAKFFNTNFANLWGLEEDWLRTEPTHGEILEELRVHRRLPEQVDFQAYKKARLELYTTLVESQEELLHLPDERVLRTVVNPHPFGGLLFTFEDVTDRLTLERSYNTLIAVQRESLNNLHEAVAVFGGDGRLKLHNPAYERIWRFTPKDLEGEPRVAELVERARDLFDYDADWPSFKEKVISRVTDHMSRTGRFERTDGTVLDYASVALPDGAILFSYLDVTDSINIERALRERNEALETADRLKSEFVANMSYELRTPLNTIIGFTEILANQYFGTLNERQVDYTRGILESSQQLLHLIDDILDLAMIQAGRLALDLQPVDINAMMTSVLSLFRERAIKQGVALEFDCAKNIGEMVADGRRLKQALYNLISNSIRHTPEQGRITLSAKRDGESIVLAVADNGVGIHEDDQARVFGKFEHAARTEGRSPGIGLGLVLVKSYIELHGGEIELKSKPGEGTTVTCRLPAEASQETVE